MAKTVTRKFVPTCRCFQVEKLLNCCNRRKSFVIKLYEKQLEACLLLALRGNAACQTALCLMLEWNLVKESDQQIQITTTLQSTESGKVQYGMLCKRQQHLKKIVRIRIYAVKLKEWPRFGDNTDDFLSCQLDRSSSRVY